MSCENCFAKNKSENRKHNFLTTNKNTILKQKYSRFLIVLSCALNGFHTVTPKSDGISPKNRPKIHPKIARAPWGGILSHLQYPPQNLRWGQTVITECRTMRVVIVFSLVVLSLSWTCLHLGRWIDYSLICSWIFDQIFGQVFGQIFGGQKIQVTVLLGRRNAVYRTTWS